MLASIDVGSNTIRMLLGRVEQGRLVPLRYERAVTRLGGDFRKGEGLAPQSMERTLIALQGFSEIIHNQPVRALRAVGTAALRRARNSSDFISLVAEKTGVALEVIDGQHEAHLSSLGVLEALDPRPDASLVIDIGGGSTELILLEGCQVRFRESYPLGVVRLCEESHSEAERMKVINAVVDRFKTSLQNEGLLDLIHSAGCEFVGTAGTVTTLAALDQQMVSYDWRKINNYILPLETLQQQYADLIPLTVAQREALPGLEAGRGDLIMPGIQILRSLVKEFSRPHIRVSDFGLLEGILINLSAASID